jgi:hypothetical protein
MARKKITHKNDSTFGDMADSRSVQLNPSTGLWVKNDGKHATREVTQEELYKMAPTLKSLADYDRAKEDL